MATILLRRVPWCSTAPPLHLTFTVQVFLRLPLLDIPHLPLPHLPHLNLGLDDYDSCVASGSVAPCAFLPSCRHPNQQHHTNTQYIITYWLLLVFMPGCVVVSLSGLTGAWVVLFDNTVFPVQLRALQ